MLRIAAKKSAEQGIKGARQNTTTAKAPIPGGTPYPAPPGNVPPARKSGGGGGFKLALGTVVAGATGVVGYAYVDPEFRHKIETTVPQVKPVFDKILGESSLSKTKQQLDGIKNKVVDAIPKRKEEAMLPPLVKPLPPPVEKREPVYVEPVNVHKEINVLPPRASPDEVAVHNQKLEQSLLKAIQQAEVRVQSATEAKILTINAVNEHAELLKKTVDNGQNANWETVTSALQYAEGLAGKDGKAEAESRNYIDQLRKVIESGKKNSVTASNPLLLNAAETANKLSHQLDELNGLVSKSRQESQVLNQYKDLIERSRQQFALEMKSILPNVDVHAKDKNLTEDELNALIAHAHLKVDQLRKQLTDQQVREEQHISRAIEDQRRADERVASERLAIEINRVRSQQELDVERALLASRSSWEGELEDQLKRASSAHSEHLEQVIRTQRQLFEIEHNQKVEEAVLVERGHHSKVVGVALSRLEGIEHALNSRVALDAENRKAKQFWIACHNLIDTIKHGNKAGNDLEQRRLPLEETLSRLQQVNPDDAFVSSVIATFPAQSKAKGLYTEQDLKNRFDKIYNLGRKTAAIDENGGSLSAYMWSYIRSMLMMELPRKFTENDRIDPHAINNTEVLARAKWHVERGDLTGALKIIQLLRGQPAQLASDWVKDMQAHLESRLLAELLVAHAAVSSIRSTY